MLLEKGVEEGRKIFGNIMKYIKMTASSNFGNMFSGWLPVLFFFSAYDAYPFCCTEPFI